MIYLDNGATTYHKPEAVIQAVADAMRHMGNSGRKPSGIPGAAGPYMIQGSCVGTVRSGNPLQVAFTANSTASLNMAVRASFTGRPCDYHHAGTQFRAPAPVHDEGKWRGTYHCQGRQPGKHTV